MTVYKCKAQLLPGKNYSAVLIIAKSIYQKVKSKSKRRPYIRSAYFKGDKIFFDNFWPHLRQKSFTDRYRRLKFFECAIELIRYSKMPPIYESRNHIQKEALYRFIGVINHYHFIVQIKEDLKRKQKFLMSFFEYTKYKK